VRTHGCGYAAAAPRDDAAGLRRGADANGETLAPNWPTLSHAGSTSAQRRRNGGKRATPGRLPRPRRSGWLRLWARLPQAGSADCQPAVLPVPRAARRAARPRCSNKSQPACLSPRPLVPAEWGPTRAESFNRGAPRRPCGVYLGWASLRGAVHKCVANVGFSPTFVDEENREKIVEAHLLEEFESDFYGETMRLLLLGYIRPEQKFDSLDALVATIRADIETARQELDAEPFSSLAGSAWLSAPAAASPSFEELDPGSIG